MVGKGTYWNLARGERVDIAEQGMLPGDSTIRYVRMSTVAILLAGPVFGLLYAVFLPFIGIAMTLILIARKLAGGLVQAAVKSTSFGWRPIEAYLDGKRRKKRDSGSSTRHHGS
jgi:hypothetical protein